MKLALLALAMTDIGVIAVDFPEWQIGEVDFVDGVGLGVSNSMKFAHGKGDQATATRVSIYALSGVEKDTPTRTGPLLRRLADTADACYSNGGRWVGTLGAEDEITGLNIIEYKHAVTDEETSFNFTFGSDIKENAFIYNETEVDDAGTKVATIQFCVMIELLRPNTTEPTEVVVVNYARRVRIRLRRYPEWHHCTCRCLSSEPCRS